MSEGEGSTLLSTYDAIFDSGWNSIFQGNRMNLKVVGLERVVCMYITYRHWSGAGQRISAARLHGVASLDVSFSPLATNTKNSSASVSNLCAVFPNLTEVDLGYSYMRTSKSSVLYNIAGDCPSLTRLSWRGCEGDLYLNGFQLRMQPI